MIDVVDSCVVAFADFWKSIISHRI